MRTVLRSLDRIPDRRHYWVRALFALAFGTVLRSLGTVPMRRILRTVPNQLLATATGGDEMGAPLNLGVPSLPEL